MTIVEFLLARIAEDEDCAQTPFPAEWQAAPEETGQPIKAGTYRVATCAESVMAHIARHDPARVLAECAAKRDLVELALGLADLHRMGDPTVPPNVGEDILRILATPYADHPDYDEAWR